MKAKDVRKKLKKKKKHKKLTGKDFLSTGSTLLNLACTGKPYRGFAKGKYYFIVGDSSSGKTFLIVRNIVYRALRVDRSKHAILRKVFTSLRQSIIDGTLKDVVQQCFPQLWSDNVGLGRAMNNSKFVYTLPNKSEIWFGGLEDKNRADKILGNEYSSIYFNECSELSFDAIQTAWTRLAEKNKRVSR